MEVKNLPSSMNFSFYCFCDYISGVFMNLCPNAPAIGGGCINRTEGPGTNHGKVESVNRVALRVSYRYSLWFLIFLCAPPKPLLFVNDK